MKAHAALVALGAALLVTGCSGAADDVAPATQDVSQDELRASAGKRLANASVDEVVDAGRAMLTEHLDAVRAAHPQMSRITSANRTAFTTVGSTSYMALGEIIDAILKTQSSVAPSSILGKLDDVARPAISEKATRGIVKCDSGGDVGLFVYDACKRAEEENAFSRAEKPAGIDFDAIRAAWRATTESSNLDNELVLPVAFPSEPNLAQLRKMADIRVPYAASAFDAIDAFATADESSAADNARAFAPIKAALRSAGIKKRYAFSGRGDGYSRNFLIVVDEHNQAWGFMSGYSE